nr:SLAP domain-containing protein [Lactobacillus crispatus]
MKKNLRIVSAAAALLAVAPVAAAGVVAPASTVSAATSQEVTDLGTLRGTIVLDRASNTQFSVKLSDAQKDAILQLGGDALKNAKPADMKDITVKSASASNSNGEFQQVVTFTVNDKAYQVTLNAKFASQQGTPYFYNKDTNTVVNDGSTVSLNEIANGFSSSDLLNAIQKHYAWKTSDQSNDTINMTTTASDVESQLVAQGLKRASNGNFDYPANGFNLKLTAKSENGNSTTITVRINASVNYNAPAFVFNNTVYYNDNTTAAGTTDNNLVLKDTKDAKVIVNGKSNDKVVTDSVLAYVQSAYGTGFDKTPADLAAHQQLINPSNIKIDSSKVNPSVAGLYPVTITASNPAGFTSKLTVYVIVMGPTEKAPQEYVKADNTKVYNINGNVVSEAANVPALAKGAAVYTFGKVTVNGVEYTRINKEGSNEFVKSSDLTATKPDTTVASQSKTIMHNAYYYDKDAKRVGTDKLTRYNSVTVAMSTTKIGDKTYYEVVENGKLSGKFINADNIDGTKRTLKHNAYVYKTSKKRANKVTLKKGEEVTTYGGTYTFKNGKQYYKINNNTEKTYVKASNF